MKTSRVQTRCGIVTIELVVALGILATVILPLAYSLVQEQRAARAYYFRAVAMEIVDGEMEMLVAGEWRAYKTGTHPYKVRAESARNLPPGDFLLSIGESAVQLEWRPRQLGKGGAISRTAPVLPKTVRRSP